MGVIMGLVVSLFPLYIYIISIAIGAYSLWKFKGMLKQITQLVEPITMVMFAAGLYPVN
jgi:hypothetical protein